MPPARCPRPPIYRIEPTKCRNRLLIGIGATPTARRPVLAFIRNQIGRPNMKKRFLCALALASFAAPALAEVGMSISIGEPGFYGRIDIGDAPRPALVYSQPMIIERTAVVRPPIYLYVPPGQVKKWPKYCHKYNACGQRVYFVQDRWYNDVYAPHYRAEHGRGGGHGGPPGYGHGRGHGRGHDD